MKSNSNSPQWESGLKILQFTDTHIFVDSSQRFDGIDTLESLKRVIELARCNHWPPDIIVLTGDLVHDSLPDAYRRVLSALNEIEVPVYCIPGNHDDPVLMQKVLCCGKVAMTKQIVLQNWQLVLLNTYIPNTHSGLLAESEKEFLDACLKNHREKYAMICLHHHPVSIGSPWMDAMALQNPGELFAILERHDQVKSIIWGHIHQRFEQQKNGIRLLGSPSTCVQFKPKTDSYVRDDLEAGYRWLELCDDGMIHTGISRLS